MNFMYVLQANFTLSELTQPYHRYSPIILVNPIYFYLKSEMYYKHLFMLY